MPEPTACHHIDGDECLSLVRLNEALARISELEADAERLEIALKIALSGNSIYREALEKCAVALEFLARYYFPDGTEARDLVKQALQR